MKIFFAGLDRDEYVRYLPWSADLVQNIMNTFADYRGDYGERYFIEGMDAYYLFRPTATHMLDCGAYSAWNSGQEISLEEYKSFLELYNDQFFAVASLDDKTSQRKTYENYRDLIDSGFLVGPVWHVIGGDLGILREYLSDPDVPLVYIGGIAKEKQITHEYSYYRLDAVFNLVGQYRKPLHSFGRTEPELLMRYPFASGDSITWVNSGKYGLVLKWDPLARTLRNIKMRKHADMEKAFGPRAKVLLGQLPDKYDRPLYHYQTAHNMEETIKEEAALEDYWQRRNVVWDYAAIDFKKRLSPVMLKDCLARRQARGVYLPGDPGYTAGMYAGYLLHRKNYRPTRKWERERADVRVPTTYEILQETQYAERLLHLAEAGVSERDETLPEHAPLADARVQHD